MEDFSWDKKTEAEFVRSKVPSSGSEWQERLDEKRESLLHDEESGFYSRSGILGYRLLGRFDTLQKKGRHWESIQESHPQIAKSRMKEVEKSFKYWYTEAQKDLISLAQKRPRTFANALNSYFGSVTNKEELWDAVTGNNQKYKDELIDIAFFLSIKGMQKEEWEKEALSRFVVTKYNLGKKILPQNVTLDFLLYNKQIVAEEEKEILEDIQSFKPKLAEILTEKTRNGKLPLSTALVEERLEKIEVRVLDELTANLHEKWGDYRSDEHTVRLSTGLPKDKRWMVYVHEVFHALSGQIDVKITDKDDPDNPLLTRYTNIKTGTYFSKEENYSVDVQKRYPNFWWLNEGLTQMLTLEVTDEKKEDNVTYEGEMKLVDMLLRQGVSRELLYGAYFENHGDSLKEGNTLPHTRELFDFSNNKFGKRFLVDLDYLIQYGDSHERGSGVAMVLEIWDEKGEDFPHHLRELLEKLSGNS